MSNLSRNAISVNTPETTYSKLAYYATSSAHATPCATKNHYASDRAILLFLADESRSLRHAKCPNLFGRVCLCAKECGYATPKKKAVAS